MKTTLMLILAALLHGCATTQPPQQMGESDLCSQFGVRPKSEELRAEIVRRNLIAERDWPMVNMRLAYVGMPLCAMYAAKGIPARENRSITSGGILVQHVFYGREYVYSRNGVVVAVQQ